LNDLETDISSESEKPNGVSMPRRRRTIINPKDLSSLLKFVLGFVFMLYGFFALTNPDMYPILGKILADGEYVELIQLDPLWGLIIMVIGALLLFYETK